MLYSAIAGLKSRCEMMRVRHWTSNLSHKTLNRYGNGRKNLKYFWSSRRELCVEFYDGARKNHCWGSVLNIINYFLCQKYHKNWDVQCTHALSEWTTCPTTSGIWWPLAGHIGGQRGQVDTEWSNHQWWQYDPVCGPWGMTWMLCWLDLRSCKRMQQWIVQMTWVRTISISSSRTSLMMSLKHDSKVHNLKVHRRFQRTIESVIGVYASSDCHWVTMVSGLHRSVNIMGHMLETNTSGIGESTRRRDVHRKGEALTRLTSFASARNGGHLCTV